MGGHTAEGGGDHTLQGVGSYHSLIHRMTFKMYAVDFCELLLYDEQKQAYHMMQHAFHNKGALEAFIK